MEDMIIDYEELKLLNIDQVCECLGLGRWSIYRLIKDNRLKTVTIGKRRLVTQGAVRAFIARLEEEGRCL
jgi:excisionase family DNA binding protein